MKPIALTVLTAIVMLAGCSKPVQDPPPAGAAATAAAPAPQAAMPNPVPADYPEKRLRSVDTAPRCRGNSWSPPCHGSPARLPRLAESLRGQTVFLR